MLKQCIWLKQPKKKRNTHERCEVSLSIFKQIYIFHFVSEKNLTVDVNASSSASYLLLLIRFRLVYTIYMWVNMSVLVALNKLINDFFLSHKLIHTFEFILHIDIRDTGDIRVIDFSFLFQFNFNNSFQFCSCNRSPLKKFNSQKVFQSLFFFFFLWSDVRVFCRVN